MTIRLGTRGSVLARWQAEWCAAQLKQQNIDVEIVCIETNGDRIQNESIVNLGTQGVFTKELQKALLCCEIDAAVHSLKDLPTEPIDGLVLAAVPKRGHYRDAFICNKFATINELPENARIGTGSLRRKTQIMYQFGNRFRIEDIRGTVETRLRQLDQGKFDAVILAEAGLERLGLANRIHSFLEEPLYLPAVGQGAIGLEIRTGDTSIVKRITLLTDERTFAAVRAERAMLQKLQGGCIAPIAALGIVENETLTLFGRIISLNGETMFETARSIPLQNNPESLGIAVADELINNGAKTILD
jgi:hydroxymethylbilane synthase